ncbi:MAG: endonuclease/exonuclease/phosphatase family protein [Paracoccaceae bacterium]
MRLATYNVEWFDSLFDDAGALLENTGWSRRYNVTRIDQLDALGIVFTAIDADAVMIIEAPDASKRRSTVAALQAFAARFGLRTRRVLVGFRNHTQQEIALLYDPDVLGAVHDPQGEQAGKKGDKGAPRFDGAFRWDLEVDRAHDIVRFSKPPLEVALTLDSGKVLRLIGVHIKSKAPHGARGPKEVMRISIENRRKQLAQSIWLRKRVEAHLSNGDSIIVMGDFNDGPGLDEYEKLFGRSSVEIVLGENSGPCLFDPHASMALTRKLGAMPTTSRFYISSKKRYLQALLDYIMVSPDLVATGPDWRIWHPFEDPVCFQTPELRQALLTASDHFPVTIDLRL